jgi:hypothetical protein
VKSDFDLAVSRAILGLRALERALHDGGPWEMECGDSRVPANRFVLDDSVQFCAKLPGSAATGTRRVHLLCRGRFVAMTDVPAEWDDVVVDWVLRLSDLVGV